MKPGRMPGRHCARDDELYDERYHEWDGPDCCYYHADGGNTSLPCGSDSVGERVQPDCPYDRRPCTIPRCIRCPHQGD